jgi:hypothetical protein
MTTREAHVDTQQELALIGLAQLLTDVEVPIGAAVAELRETAGDRADLLASAAGSQIGTYLASPRTTDPHRLLAGALLILAGADPDLVEDAVEDVRRWTGIHAPGLPDQCA